MHFAGWKITGVTAAVLASFLVAIGVWYGPSEESMRAVVRISARSAVVLFLLAFSASSLHELLRKSGTAWLLRNRRYIGVSFAVAHFYHLIALILLSIWFPHPFRDDLNWVTIVGGGLAYVLIAAMAATSSDSAYQWLGGVRWRRLHTIGSYYVWFIFAQSYFPHILEGGAAVPLSIALAAGLLVRLLRVRSPLTAKTLQWGKS